MNDPCDSRCTGPERAQSEQAEPEQAEPRPEPEPTEPLPVPSAGRTGPAAGINLQVKHEAGDWSDFGPGDDLEQLIRSAAGALSRHRACRQDMPACAAIALSSDQQMRELNRSFRGKDKPTNVLSFPQRDDAVFAGEAGEARFIGDIVLASETIMREAREQGTLPAHHLQHLVVHGVLHLLGYDHGNDEEARAMETLEAQILNDLGIADPYADAAAMPGFDPERNEVNRP